MKVTKTYITREGHYSHEDPHGYQAEIEYSTYAKKFFIKMPDEMKGFACVDKFDQKRLVGRVKQRSGWINNYYSGDTEEKVIADAREHLGLFVEAVPTNRKVILYLVGYESGDLRRGSAGGSLNKASSRVTSLSMDYIVCYENTYGSRVTYERRTEENGEIKRLDVTGLQWYGVDRKNYRAIGWTEEREKYFASLMDNVEALVQRIDEFVRDEQAFIVQVDTGGQTLLTDGEKP